jgi:hypothetical protein
MLAPSRSGEQSHGPSRAERLEWPSPLLRAEDQKLEPHHPDVVRAGERAAPLEAGLSPQSTELGVPERGRDPTPRSTIASDGLRPALKRAGLRRVTIHSLRHSHWFRDVKTDAMAGLAKLVCAPTGEKVVAKW